MTDPQIQVFALHDGGSRRVETCCTRSATEKLITFGYDQVSYYVAKYPTAME